MFQAYKRKRHRRIKSGFWFCFTTTAVTVLLLSAFIGSLIQDYITDNISLPYAIVLSVFCFMFFSFLSFYIQEKTLTRYYNKFKDVNRVFFLQKHTVSIPVLIFKASDVSFKYFAAAFGVASTPFVGNTPEECLEQAKTRIEKGLKICQQHNYTYQTVEPLTAHWAYKLGKAYLVKSFVVEIMLTSEGTVGNYTIRLTE